MFEQQQSSVAKQPQPGQVKHDDRGNAVWQWAADSARSAIVSTSQLIRKLDVSNLSLESDGEHGHESAAVSPEEKKPRARGGDPYASNAGAQRRSSVPATTRQPNPPRLSWWKRLLGGGRRK